MVITLYVNNIIDKMKAVSHREVAAIEDVEARYRVEAGSEKIDDINGCVSDAYKRLLSRCTRFLKDSFYNAKDNNPSIPTEYVIELSLSERRAINKADPIEEAMNTFLVEYALSKFYSIVSMGDLSNKHSLLALEAGGVLDQLLYTKQPPRV